MDVNYYGNVFTIRSVLPIMKKQKSGRIISVASVLGLFGCLGYSSYAPSKAAIISLYQTLHQENYYYGISFSVAVPASIGTDSFYKEEQLLKPEETLILEQDDPILTPEEVSKPIVDSLEHWDFLISPSGLNSHLMTIACAGFSPASFNELFWQVFSSGIIRFIAYFAFNSKVRSISKKIRSKEQNEKMRK